MSSVAHVCALLPSCYSFNMVLITHDDVNAVVLWDLTTGNSVKFDFNQELAAVNKRSIKSVRGQFVLST